MHFFTNSHAARRRVVVAAALLASVIPSIADASDWQITLDRAPTGNLQPICLYVPSDSIGVGVPAWRASLDNRPGVACAERMGADLAERRIYLTMPGFERKGMFLNGLADASCPDGPNNQGYSVCTSAWLTFMDDAPNFRYLLTDDIEAAVRVANLPGLLDALVQSKAPVKAASAAPKANLPIPAPKAPQAPTAPLSQPTAATAPAVLPMNAPTAAATPAPTATAPVESSRPLRLPVVPEAAPPAPPVPPTYISKYLSAFEEATTPEQLASFISTYEHDDPAELVPEAKRRFDAYGEHAKVRLTQSKTEEALHRSLIRIAICQRQVKQSAEAVGMAQSALSADAKVAQAAGELLMVCRARIDADYAEYKSLGGKLPLEAIH